MSNAPFIKSDRRFVLTATMTAKPFAPYAIATHSESVSILCSDQTAAALARFLGVCGDDVLALAEGATGTAPIAGSPGCGTAASGFAIARNVLFERANGHRPAFTGHGMRVSRCEDAEGRPQRPDQLTGFEPVPKPVLFALLDLGAETGRDDFDAADRVNACYDTFETELADITFALSTEETTEDDVVETDEAAAPRTAVEHAMFAGSIGRHAMTRDPEFFADDLKARIGVFMGEKANRIEIRSLARDPLPGYSETDDVVFGEGLTYDLDSTLDVAALIGTAIASGAKTVIIQDIGT